MDTNSKATLKVIFLTMFLDIVGFSLIFPLFPHLLRHYLAVDGESLLLRTLASGGASPVLFGGILGGLYSFLQFLAAPLWGGLSDKKGRRPILLLSVFSLGVSYLLWAFASSFALLVLARILGGLMGGNISVATAAIGDVTGPGERARGMALVGVAFALGLILGPALGGALSLVRLDTLLPGWGFNPFSAVGLFGAILCFGNFLWLWAKLKETRPVGAGGPSSYPRSINVLRLWQVPGARARLIVRANFFFILSFSGMEFTLAFLAVDRFAFTPGDNALMFVFVGLVLAIVQGGWVRRRAFSLGEGRVARWGLLLTMAGLLLLGWAPTVTLFYGGLILLGTGSAMVIPCLTALCSLHTGPESQGQVMGVFRSLGALGRVLGPPGAALVYWGHSPILSYALGAALLLVPLAQLVWAQRGREGKSEA